MIFWSKVYYLQAAAKATKRIQQNAWKESAIREKQRSRKKNNGMKLGQQTTAQKEDAHHDHA